MSEKKGPFCKDCRFRKDHGFCSVISDHIARKKEPCEKFKYKK